MASFDLDDVGLVNLVLALSMLANVSYDVSTWYLCIIQGSGILFLLWRGRYTSLLCASKASYRQ